MTVTGNTIATLVRYAARVADDDIILLGGSTAVALGQGSSDYDLYIIRLEDEEGWSELPTIAPDTHLDVLVELEVFAASALLTRARHMRAVSATDGQALRKEIAQETLVRYSALLTARPLPDHARAWPGLAADLDHVLYQRVTYRWHHAWCNELRRLT